MLPVVNRLETAWWLFGECFDQACHLAGRPRPWRLCFSCSMLPRNQAACWPFDCSDVSSVQYMHEFILART